MLTQKLLYLPIIAFAVTLFATPLIRRFSLRMGSLDAPNSRKKHKAVVPSSGGIAIFLGFLTVILFSANVGPEVEGLFLGATFIAIVGFLDDVFDLPASVKFLGQIIAALIAIAAGVRIDFISDLSNLGTFDLGLLAIPATVFWILAITNAINFLDGLDGLAAGVVGITSATLGIVFLMMGQPELALIAFVLSASAFAFLPHNFSEKKKIFMGDSGSQFLGYSLAVLSIMGSAKVATLFSVLVPIIVLAVPIFDTAFVILKRLKNRKPITQADREHLHHRLVDIMRLDNREAVFLIYTLTLILSGIAIFSAGLTVQANVTIFLISIIALSVFILGGINHHQKKRNGKGKH